jgi:hypothetical protein
VPSSIQCITCEARWRHCSPDHLSCALTNSHGQTTRGQHEANLAWALALAAKPFLDVVDRNDIFVAIGAGETFAVVRALVKWVAIKRGTRCSAAVRVVT